ncbi:hypothetical protein F5890DRAFT_1477770 [Lentinula detonsa]|uniref:GST N-terminal domain-containing protein n=1 Tax=Lentinula detonsa TaxID=2804962 RepID=A0AA38UNP1_9AGAR|nr:hypothetical protein F5890DRAFT_1477770 [Lentinula detonsa]
MIVVHHLNKSRSQRILWLLEELGVPYEVKKYQRMPNHQAPSSLLEVHPLGKSPVIEVRSEGLSDSIVYPEVYLLQNYGKRQTLSAEGVLDDLYYTYYAESTLRPLIVVRQRLSRFANRAPWFLRPVFRYVLGAYRKMNPWFARGSDGPTAADYAMIFGLEGLQEEKAITPETHPAMTGYIEKVHARSGTNIVEQVDSVSGTESMVADR